MSNRSMPLVTSGARRGCGYRQPGGAYFAVLLGPGGHPIEEFLIDPLVVIEHPARLGLASVGVTLIERDGVTPVLDIVGREHYPTVASFIDEARRLGVSRRAPRTIDFGRITSKSRMLLAHAHADIADAAEFPCERRCPCHVAHHLADGFADMCAPAVVGGAARRRQAPARAVRLVPDPPDRGGQRPGRRQSRAHDRAGRERGGARRRGGMVSSQLALLPTTAPELRRESLALELIDGFANAAPSARLRELIRDLGLLQPIVVVPSRSGRFRIVEGRRRCKAIAELAEAGKWPAPPQVEALVIAGGQAGRGEV
jgi:ParB-like nuclease domain